MQRVAVEPGSMPVSVNMAVPASSSVMSMVPAAKVLPVLSVVSVNAE